MDSATLILLDWLRLALWIVCGTLFVLSVLIKMVRTWRKTFRPVPQERSDGERRRVPRYPCSYVLDYEDVMGRRVTLARLVNLSTTGACVTGAGEWKPGMRVTGFLRSSAASALPITCRVMWSNQKDNKTYYGLRFLGTQPSTASIAA